MPHPTPPFSTLPWQFAGEQYHLRQKISAANMLRKAELSGMRGVWNRLICTCCEMSILNHIVLSES